jgi:hypothetical protein
MGSFGVNRRFAGCPTCGHPLAAHMGGGFYCGCRGRAPRPASSRGPVSNPATNPKPRRIAKPSPPPRPKSPTEQLLEFAQLQMSEPDTTQLLIRLADARSVHINPPKRNPWPLLRQIAEENYTRAEISKYLQVLRDRKASDAPLIRPKRQTSMNPLVKRRPA